MKDEIVKYDTSVLAKEKGFDYKDNFYAHWHNDKSKLAVWNSDDWDIQDSQAWRETGIPAPTQSLLQKWLREVHNIHCGVDVYFDNDEVLYESWMTYGCYEGDSDPCLLPENIFNTYEEALEDSLFDALKSIKNA